MYATVPPFGGVVGNPMVASPGYNRGYRLKTTAVTAAGTGGVISALAGGQDAPYSLYQLVQLKDAFGTPILTGPGLGIRVVEERLRRRAVAVRELTTEG